MPGVPREIIKHRLAVDPAKRPVKQKLQHLCYERQEAARKERKALLGKEFS